MIIYYLGLDTPVLRPVLVRTSRCSSACCIGEALSNEVAPNVSEGSQLLEKQRNVQCSSPIFFFFHYRYYYSLTNGKVLFNYIMKGKGELLWGGGGISERGESY